ncbi:hypothetical protein HUG10_19975 (plasmid) [Halorarum halophilum]|uniref:Uncharacterized protein n=1 Tax=Halorarum halophilum TaxID=2743090 RepID=A0A7D5GIF4_9EURY|nr:DUF6293 family protein [Halobaculum halophilum]QLG29890.1 hypothetical protein HUG10_19975 [Halobaculum halophilum]
MSTIVAELEAARIDVTTVAVDLFDMYGVLGEVTTIAAQHAEDLVHVNVSTGTKLSAIGAAIACMELSTNATAYYVHPEEYAHGDIDEPLTSEYADDEALPGYPIDSPTAEQVAVMDYVHRKDTTVYTPKKKDLIEFGKQAALPFYANSTAKSDKAAFGRLKSRILDPLTERKYVTVEHVGRRKQVSLTELGEDTLRAFRHKLSESPECGVVTSPRNRPGNDDD